MADPKTRATSASVDRFLDRIKDEQMRSDAQAIAGIMRKATKSAPQMWGAAIVGFGSYQLTYADGRQASWPVTAFAPRRHNITLYLAPAFEGRQTLLSGLGTYTCGKSCVYIKRLSDVHLPTLEKLLNRAVKHVSESQPAKTRAKKSER